jgi:DnaK suppressor protein
VRSDGRGRGSEFTLILPSPGSATTPGDVRTVDKGTEAVMNTRMRPSPIALQRSAELRPILAGRRREILWQIQGKTRGMRAMGGDHRHSVVDAGETPDADTYEEVDAVVIQMNRQTLARIDDALARIDDGTFGYCSCAAEISESRLRALPFAIRCRDCEAVREAAEQRERQMSRREFGAPLQSG